MPSPMARWSPLRRRRPRDLLLRRARPGDLDIARPAPHDMSDADQERARARIEDLVGRLQPRAIDAGSREVLNNLINSWMDQANARVNGHHIEQTAVSAMLIGLAREEVTRRRSRYEADYARAQHACRTLAVTYQQLTGREMTDLPSPHPAQIDDQVFASTLGAMSWTDTGTTSGLLPPGLLPPGADPADPVPAGPVPANPVLDGPVMGGPVPANSVPDGPVMSGPVPAGPVPDGLVPAGPGLDGPVLDGPVLRGPVPAGPPGGPEPDGWPHVRLTDLPAVPMPRDGLTPPARNGAAVTAQADPGDSGPDGI
jgi:hypothetical protein